MNNKKNFKKGYRYEVIKILYMNGAISYNTLRLLPASPIMNIRAYRKLKEEGIVETVSTAGRKMIILKDYELRKEEYEKDMPEGYEEYFYAQTKAVRKKVKGGDITATERMEKCGEVLAIMKTAGVKCYLEECPKYRWQVAYDINENYYHNSFDIKSTLVTFPVSKEEGKSLGSTRIIGCINSQGGDYAVYSISQGLIEWSRSGELRVANHIKRLNATVYRGERDLNAILYIKNLMVIEKIVNNENLHRTVNLLSIDNVYPNMYALPIDNKGIEMTRLLTKDLWDQYIYASLISEEVHSNTKGLSVTCDGYDGEHYIFIYCVPNITKLKLFLRKAQADLEKEKYILYCFDWQLEHIKDMAQHIAVIKVVEFEPFIKTLFEVME